MFKYESNVIEEVRFKCVRQFVKIPESWCHLKFVHSLRTSYNIEIHFGMHIELSTSIEQIQINPPKMKMALNKNDIVGNAAIVDGEGNPVTLHIHTTANEEIRVEDKRAYLDVKIEEAPCLDILNQLKDHIVKQTVQVHGTPQWFNKELPENIIVDLFNDFLTHENNTTDTSCLRLKTLFKNKQPQVHVYTVCDADLNREPTNGDVEENIDANETIVTELSAYAGKQVCYEVQLLPLLCLRSKFCLYFQLVAVHHSYSPDDVDFTELILNNEIHREEKETIEKMRDQMLQRKHELCKLELLKEEVEKEVATVMSKREDIDRRYNETMAQIQEMEELHNVENDIVLAEFTDDEDTHDADDYEDEILEPLEGMTDCSMDELVNGAVTVDTEPQHLDENGQTEESNSLDSTVEQEKNNENVSSEQIQTNNVQQVSASAI